MKCTDAVEFLHRIAPVHTGVPDDDQTGWAFGDPAQEVRAMGCTWSPTLKVLQEAARRGINFLITHEPLFFPYVDTPWYRNWPVEAKPANRARRAILERNGIAVYGFHSPWDAMPRDGTVDRCAAALGFRKVIGAGFAAKVYEVDEVSVGELAKHVRRSLASPPVRVIGDLEQRVRRVGLCIGGLGQTFGAPEEVVDMGAEAIVFGEMLEYTLQHGVELGVAMVEAGHCATETPGMRRLAQVLEEALPEAPVCFLDAALAWTCP